MARLFIREWRTFRGLTQGEVAEAIGKTTATVSRIENGVADTTTTQLDSIARALGVEPPALYAPPPVEVTGSEAA